MIHCYWSYIILPAINLIVSYVTDSQITGVKLYRTLSMSHLSTGWHIRPGQAKTELLFLSQREVLDNVMCHPVLPPVISLSRSHFVWSGGTSFRNAEEIGSIQSAKLGEDNAFRAPPLHSSPLFRLCVMMPDVWQEITVLLDRLCCSGFLVPTYMLPLKL